MKLYIETKFMTLKDGEHELILRVSEEEFLGYDKIIESDILSKNEEGKYIVREQKTWWSFPLFELKNGKIIDFDYTKYAYFQNTERRNMLAFKISELYNISGELKILRETINYILKELKLNIPDNYDKMNTKIKEIIKKNPKENK